MPEPSVGEAGGVLAGVVSVAVVVGHGLRWLLGWRERRARRLQLDEESREQTRAQKLAAWHAELIEREKRIDLQQAEYHEAIENRLEAVLKAQEVMQQRQLAALGAINLLSAALRAIDANNPALNMADELLRAAFPLAAHWPPDMVALLAQMTPSGAPTNGED